MNHFPLFVSLVCIFLFGLYCLTGDARVLDFASHSIAFFAGAIFSEVFS